MSAKPNIRKNTKTKRMDVSSKLLPGALMIPILVVAASMSLGYLWLCSNNEDIGKNIKRLEEEKKDLDRHVMNEEFKWANATSPENIERLLKLHHLEMELPKGNRIVRIEARTAGTYAGWRKQGSEIAAGGMRLKHE